MEIYSLVKKYLKQQTMFVVIYILCTLILALSGVITPYLSGTFIDNLIADPSENIIIYYTVMYISISVLQIIFSYIMSIVVVKLQTKLTYEFNKNIINHLQKTPLMFLQSQNITYLNQRVYSDCSTLINFSMTFLNGCIANIATFLFCFYFILKTSIEISVLMFFLILLYIIVYTILKKPLFRIKYQYKELQAKYISALHEQLNKSKIIKVFSLFQFFSNRLISVFDAMMKISLKNTKMNFIFQSSDTVISLISQVVLFLYGGFQILNGNLTIGSFTILSSYFGHLINSTKFFVNLGGQYLENRVSAQRIYEILDIQLEANGSELVNSLNTLSIKNLSFSYSQKSIISDFSYTFEKNKIYQIIGANGKGKTTLINIILGLYPSEYIGEIFYNDINMKKVDLYHFRKKNLSYVDQNALVFDGTIKDNICLDLKFSDKELFSYINLFSLNRYFDSYYDEHINENNANLSGGEVKKTVIIRSLIKKDTTLLIMDEPSNSLDKKSVNILKHELNSGKKNKITIIISHDKSFNDIADEIINL